MKKWIETKKEIKTTVNGVETVITQEPKPTFWITVSKSTTALAIFIPLVLLYVQYLHGKTQKANEDLSQLFVNVALDIETIRNSTGSDKSFHTATNNLLYTYPAKIAVFKIDSLHDRYTAVAASARKLKAIDELLFMTQDFMEGYNHITFNMITSFPYEDPLHPERSVKKYAITFPEFLPEMKKDKRIQQIDDWNIRFHQLEKETLKETSGELAAAFYPNRPSVYTWLWRDLYGVAADLDDLKLYLKSDNQQIFDQYKNSNPKSRYNFLYPPSRRLREDLMQLKADRQKIDQALVSNRHLFENAVLSNIKN